MKKIKPTTPGSRGTIIQSFKMLTAKNPFKALVKGQKRNVGRNSKGRITMRHKGGGHKRLYRMVDFLYIKKDVKAVVKTIEYDPNRTGRIALICYEDGAHSYILAPRDLKVGDTIITAEKAPIVTGNRMALQHIPVGTFVYNIELHKGGGSRLVRSAGNGAEVVAHDQGFVSLKLPSSEVRKVVDKAYASIGKVSNEENRLRVIGKAGRARNMGRRPRVRGSAMNAVDHPYGGGEGRSPRGRRRALTKWGKPCGKGQKTRNVKKYSSSLIVKRRQVGKRR